MNFHHRSTVTVGIFRPLPQQDTLGSVYEGFSAPHQTLSARIVTQSGDLKSSAPGFAVQEGLTLLLPPCADIAPADGVSIAPDTVPAYRCVRVQRYPLHTEALLERRTV